MSTDPWQVLGIERGASADALRARYVELVKLHPPDRDPLEFERIRDAYRSAADPLRAARERLFGPPALTDLAELREILRAGTRRPVEAAAWLAVLAERR